MSSTEITVTSEKPPLLTLWLDTWVVIKLAKMRKGETLQEIEVERLERLKELVVSLVGEEKLLCPQGDHEDEYEAKRLEREIEEEWSRFSYGVRLYPRGGIEDRQIDTAMRCYCEGRKHIEIPYMAYFFREPIGEVRKTKALGGVVKVKFPHIQEVLSRKETIKIQAQVEFVSFPTTMTQDFS